jgi:hypothetical protein
MSLRRVFDGIPAYLRASSAQLGVFVEFGKSNQEPLQSFWAIDPLIS